MAKPFGHEKLVVYQKGMCFLALGGALLETLPRRVAACDHLGRGGESILLNIAHASSAWSPKERIVYLGNANGSSLECAACLDVLVSKELLSEEDVYPSKSLLAEMVRMLIAMRKTTTKRVSEDHAAYRTNKDRLFTHEDLDVYQVSLQLVGWLESAQTDFSCGADLKAKLDKSTTSIVLNIAEGNGRFSGIDQAKFYRTAFKSTIQSASLIDIATINATPDAADIEQARVFLRRIAAMLSALQKAVTNA